MRNVGKALRTLAILFLAYLGIVGVTWKYWSLKARSETREPHYNLDEHSSALVHSVLLRLKSINGASMIGDKIISPSLSSSSAEFSLAVLGDYPSFHERSTSASGFAKAKTFESLKEVIDSWGSESNIIVLFESCNLLQTDPTSFSNIYRKMDDILQCAQEISSKIPKAVIVWHNKPIVVKESTLTLDVKELDTLWQHLIVSYLVKEHGLLVVHENRSLRTHVADLVFQNIQTICSKLEESSRANEIGIASTGHHMLASHQNALLQQTNAHQSLHAMCDFLLYTRRYNARCHPPDSRSHAVLVTGLGGAGTHHVARALSVEGWRMRHEKIAEDGAVSWFYAVNDRAIDLPYPFGTLAPHQSGLLYPRFAYVIHLVRHPLAQISSFTAHTNKSYDFVVKTMKAVLPRMPATSSANSSYIITQFEQARAKQWDCSRGESCHLHFAALTWLFWNRFVQRFADVTFRIEDSEDMLNHVCELASKPVGSLLLSKKRLCDVDSCPAVKAAMQMVESTDVIHSVKSYLFNTVDTLFDVCGINEAMFERVAVHKRHLKYTLEDIRKADNILATEIMRDTTQYGWWEERN